MTWSLRGCSLTGEQVKSLWLTYTQKGAPARITPSPARKTTVGVKAYVKWGCAYSPRQHSHCIWHVLVTDLVQGSRTGYPIVQRWGQYFGGHWSTEKCRDHTLCFHRGGPRTIQWRPLAEPMPRNPQNGQTQRGQRLLALRCQKRKSIEKRMSVFDDWRHTGSDPAGLGYWTCLSAFDSRSDHSASTRLFGKRDWGGTLRSLTYRFGTLSKKKKCTIRCIHTTEFVPSSLQRSKP